MAIERSQKRLTLTVEEAANALGIGRSLAYEGVRTGEIPSVRIGRRILIPVAGIEQILKNASTQEQELD